MVWACRTALTNSVYLQGHHATRCSLLPGLLGLHRNSHLKYWLVNHPKHERIRNYACLCRLGELPVHRSSTGFWTSYGYWLAVIVKQTYYKPAGACTLLMYLPQKHRNTAAKGRTGKAENNLDTRDTKCAATTTSVKMKLLKGLFINVPFYNPHQVVILRTSQKGLSNFNNTTLYTVSTLASWEGPTVWSTF